MAITLTKESQRPVFDDDVAERGSVLYERLKEPLERNFLGRYVAIHVDSGDYEVAGWSGKATRALRVRQPEGLLFVRVIGPPTERERRMAARLMAAEQEGRS